MKLWRKPFDLEEKATIPAEIELDKDRCKGCGFCVEYCPREVLKTSNEMNSKGYVLPEIVDIGKCVACGYCEVICPEFAMKIKVPQK